VAAVAESLSLTNVTASHQRVETLSPAAYDYAVSRAVAPLKTLIAWARPLVRAKGNGSLICLKGGDLAEEIAQSGSRPRLTAISSFFSEPWFQGKYVMEVPLP